jgi:hypothetical protein
MSYATTTKKAPIGTVSTDELRTTVIDVQVDQVAVHPDADVLIRLNGRPLRRMTRHQAARLGLVREVDVY